MSIADQINRLNNAKAAIKQSIENKGVDVSDSALLDEYPALIDDIKIGDSSYENPDFYEERTNGGIDYSYLFYSAKQAPNVSNFNTSKTINMNATFQNSSLTKLDLSKWDTSNVTNMDYMFGGCTSLTELDISNFNIEKVKSLSNMFYNCSKLTEINVSSFKTSHVTNMYCTFQTCGNLTELDLSTWDTSNVTRMDYMFSGCSKLKTIIGELDASNLTNGFYAGSSSHVFPRCTLLESVYIKNIYKNCTMTNASKWSINLGDTIVKDECLVYIINELPDLINDKGLTATDKIVFTLPPTNTLTAEQVQVAIDKGWSVANTTY